MKNRWSSIALVLAVMAWVAFGIGWIPAKMPESWLATLWSQNMAAWVQAIGALAAVVAVGIVARAEATRAAQVQADQAEAAASATEAARRARAQRAIHSVILGAAHLQSTITSAHNRASTGNWDPGGPKADLQSVQAAAAVLARCDPLDLPNPAMLTPFLSLANFGAIGTAMLEGKVAEGWQIGMRSLPDHQFGRLADLISGQMAEIERLAVQSGCRLAGETRSYGRDLLQALKTFKPGAEDDGKPDAADQLTTLLSALRAA